MTQALTLARKGRDTVAPNPLVGAVVVNRGVVVGKGFHERPGQAHAEVCALAEAGPRAMGAELFVNLEPCCHLKKRTPPCTKEIIQSGIRRVVVASFDPNPEVSGEGVRELRRAGIDVSVGLLDDKAFELNRGFFSLMRNQRPFITLKGAASLDGRIATSSGDSQWISGGPSLLLAHRLRDTHDGILVGVGTVLTDDPLLTTRIPGKKSRNPVRIILDTQARTPLDSRVMQTVSNSRVVIIAGSMAPESRVMALRAAGAEVLECSLDESGNIDLDCLLDKLVQLGILTLLVEGGGHVTGSFLSRGYVDRIRLVLAPLIIGGDDAICWLSGGHSPRSLSEARRFPVPIRSRQLGNDVLLSLDLWDVKTIASDIERKGERDVFRNH